MPITRFGRSAGLPGGLARRCCQRRLRARPPSIAASLEPVVEQPVASLGVRRVPEVGEDVDAAHLELGRLRVLVLVDHVLVEALGHQLLGLRLHPGGDEGRQVEAGVAVEHQLVVDDLVGDVGRQLAVRELVPRNLLGLERVERRHQQVFRLPELLLLMCQRHRCHLPFGARRAVESLPLSALRRPPASSCAGEERSAQSESALADEEGAHDEQQDGADAAPVLHEPVVQPGSRRP